MIRPKITIVSGMTTSGRTRPNSSGFSAIAPTDAAPITFSAQAVASPVPATVKAIAMPISPCASEELDEKLDVVKTNRLNDCGHGSKEEHYQVEEQGSDYSNEKAEDQEDDVPRIEGREDHGLQHNDVERERHGGLRDADRRKARIRYDVRQETKEFHDVKRTLRSEQEPNTADEQGDCSPRNRIVWTESDLYVHVSGPREPSQGFVPNQVPKRRSALRVEGPPRRSDDHDDKEASENEQPSDLAQRVLPAVTHIVDETDDKPDR